MRAFSRPTPIHRLSTEARWAYSVFCVFLLAGYASSAWFYLDDELGARPSATVRYLLGDAAAGAVPAEAAPPADDGPALELPPDAGAVSPAPMRLEKPARQVMETFHFHLFSVSVVLMILAHLFMMCALPARLKQAVILVGSAATLVHLLTPPLVRFAGPGWAALMFPSAVLMGLTWLLMTLWPLFDLWRPPPPEPELEARLDE